METPRCVTCKACSIADAPLKVQLYSLRHTVVNKNCGCPFLLLLWASLGFNLSGSAASFVCYEQKSENMGSRMASMKFIAVKPSCCEIGVMDWTRSRLRQWRQWPDRVSGCLSSPLDAEVKHNKKAATRISHAVRGLRELYLGQVRFGKRQ